MSKARRETKCFRCSIRWKGQASSPVQRRTTVSAPEAVQRERALARGTMTEAQFEAIRAKQMPDAEKRARADHVVVTDTLDHARAQVEAIVAGIRETLDA